jgi:hypothetical protein
MSLRILNDMIQKHTTERLGQAYVVPLGFRIGRLATPYGSEHARQIASVAYRTARDTAWCPFVTMPFTTRAVAARVTRGVDNGDEPGTTRRSQWE